MATLVVAIVLGLPALSAALVGVLTSSPAWALVTVGLWFAAFAIALGIFARTETVAGVRLVAHMVAAQLRAGSATSGEPMTGVPPAQASPRQQAPQSDHTAPQFERGQELAHIRVRRLDTGRDLRPTYTLLIDDIASGDVRRGEMLEVAVSSGRHTIAMIAGPDYASPPMDVTLTGGSCLTLACMPAVTTVTSMLGVMRGKFAKPGIRLLRVGTSEPA
jgi:hypothetical protein